MVGKTALGKYRLIRPLGRGSNAEVFLAEPVGRPELRVVVKRVHDHVAAHPKFRQLFDAEVRSMANFHHPYAVRLIDASTTDPIGPCMVLDYVPGVTLEDLLARTRGGLDVERTGRLLGYFCHALQAAHNAGIVHRDLKPSNLMVTGAGTPGESLKVMDFGFAGFADKPHIHLAELTGHGPIYAMGTPGYVSPEMIRGDRVDGRSDLYSVGVILFEMLTGRLPFHYQTQDKLLTAHIKETPPAFRKINRGDIPPGVEATVQLALSKYPNERQQTAQDVAEMYGRAIGTDLWAKAEPVGYTPPAAAAAPVPTPPPAPRRGPLDPYKVSYEFDAFMPERLAAAKLRGFVEDVGAEVVASEPGLIRMRVGLPAGYDPDAKGSSVFGWLLNRKPAVSPGREPIGLDLHMNKPDPSQPRLSVVVEFGPIQGFPPKNAPTWRDRCDKLHQMLRQYLGT